MKRKALILFLLTCIALPVYAQQKSWTGYISGSGWPDSSIVRTWNDTFVVAKYSYGGKRYLSLCQVFNFLGTASGDSVFQSVWTMPIPDTVDILDFRIVNNSLVFCGAFNDGMAAYGIMSPNLNNHTSTANPDIFRIYRVPLATSLTRLAVAQEKMFAVGENGSSASCIVEVMDIFWTPSNIRFVHVGAGSNSAPEQLDDVVVVGDRVVFLGRDARQTGYHQLTLRSVSTQLGLLDPDLGNDYHMLAPYQDILSSVRGAATISDMMDIAFSQTDLQTGVNSLQVHHVTPYPGVPVTQNAQGYGTGTTTSVSEAVFLPHLHWLTVLAQYSNAASRFVTFVVTGSGGYVSPMYYVPNDRYNSMDLFGTDAITCWGNKKIFLQKANYPTTSCLQYNALNINPVLTFGWQNNVETVNIHHLQLTPETVGSPAQTETLNRECGQK